MTTRGRRRMICGDINRRAHERVLVVLMVGHQVAEAAQREHAHWHTVRG